MLERLRNAILIVLGSAVLLRVAWVLLAPVLPFLVLLLALLGVFSMLFRRHQ